MVLLFTTPLIVQVTALLGPVAVSVPVERIERPFVLDVEEDQQAAADGHGQSGDV
jgi:hypothetical protein